MNQKITYRIASENDHTAILLLYNKMYQFDRSLKDFRWLVQGNPSGEAILFIAELEGKVVGMQSLVPYVFVKNGELVKTFKSEDTLVEKKLRGKGIFSKLYEMVHDYAGDKLVWGLTDKKAILVRVNMPSSERLTIAVSVKKPSLVSDNKGIHRFVAKTLFYSYLFFKSTFTTKKVKAELKQKEISPLDYGGLELQNFFESLSKQNSDIYFPAMNSAYLKWRLIDNPNLKEYKIIVSHFEDGTIAICSIIGIDNNAAHWQSFYALPVISEDERIAHITTLRKKLFDSGVNLIHSWLFECNKEVGNVKNLFFKSGFSKVRDGLWIVHNSTNKDIDVHKLYFCPLLGIR